jgi:PqqD family protein of HPr-rel-A system
MKLTNQHHWTASMDMTVPCRRDGVVPQVLDGEAVLFDPQSGCTHRMNQTALVVWRACDGQSTTRQLAARLTQAYDVAMETALEDVEQLIAAFAQAGLVTEADHQ